jgi:hypothetical protein
MPRRSLVEARTEAGRVGLNAFGLVDALRFDRSQPSERRARRLMAQCGTIVVLGRGGRAAVPAAAAGDCVRNAVDEVARPLRTLGRIQAVYADEVPQLSFSCLAEAAGLGTVSPVSGLLLHPEYGPWLQLCGALLIDGRPFGEIGDASIADRFNPCCGCTKPCLECEDVGGRRCLCPVGSEHRDVHVAAKPAAPLPRVQSWCWTGALRMLPRFLRDRWSPP